VPEQHQQPGDREAAAAYLAEMTGNLAALARQHGLDALGFILDMAKLEAEYLSRQLNIRR
jgi:hypothetical protein